MEATSREFLFLSSFVILSGVWKTGSLLIFPDATVGDNEVSTSWFHNYEYERQLKL
jgi:hypothetical protein